MMPDIWLALGAGLVAGALALLYACLQVAGAASDAADRALARVQLLGVQLPARSSDWLPPAEQRRGDSQ